MFEHRGQAVPTEPVVVMVRPTADLGLYLVDMADWPVGWRQQREWLAVNDGFRQRVLDLLGASGPLASRDIPDSAEVLWKSSGWTHDRNLTQMLESLASRGEVAVAGRRGRQRLNNVGLSPRSTQLSRTLRDVPCLAEEKPDVSSPLTTRR